MQSNDIRYYQIILNDILQNHNFDECIKNIKFLKVMNRSEMMSRIRSKNTKPEICLRKILKGTYLRQHPKIFGKPDFGLTSKKIVVFVDGCFWHKCASCYKEPTTRKEFWISKMEKNVQRDKKVNRELKKLNYKVIRIWEHELKFDEQKVRLKMLRLLK